jgi:hypothetical protein
MDERAERIIQAYEAEKSKASAFRTIYQQVADLVIPRFNQITSTQQPDQAALVDLVENTAQLRASEMVSGLLVAFFPPGDQAFALTMADRDLAETDLARRYWALASEITRRELYNSNFMLQMHEALISSSVLGLTCLMPRFDTKRYRLAFRCWDVGSFTFKCDYDGYPDTVFFDLAYTARQAVQRFGNKAGERVVKANSELKTESTPFKFVQMIGPRSNRNVQLKDNLNMACESVVVNLDEKVTVEESGFKRFPPAIARWEKRPGDKYGLGQGTKVLGTTRMLQKVMTDYVDACNMWCRPPKEVLSTFQGEVKIWPDALNYVEQLGTIKGIEGSALGNIPITKDMLQELKHVVGEAFFQNVFDPMAGLTGDRRNRDELWLRKQSAAKKIAGSIYRQQEELFSPTIIESVHLLIEWGKIPPIPDELQDRPLRVEYMGELALAMRDQQALAFERMAALLAQLQTVFPEALDTINADEALPDIALDSGMKVSHIATAEQIAAKRKARADRLANLEAMQAAQTTADVYAKGTKEPGPNSASKALMEMANA